MNSSGHDERNEIRVELKYCEHCGGLWLRDCGSGEVYCPACQPEVAQLPVPRKGPLRARLPIGRHAVLGRDYDFEGCAAEDDELRVRGGAA